MYVCSFKLSTSVFVCFNFVIGCWSVKGGFISSLLCIPHPTKCYSANVNESNMGLVEVNKGLVVEQSWVCGWIVEQLKKCDLFSISLQ